MATLGKKALYATSLTGGPWKHVPMGSVHVLHSTPGCRAVERQLKTAQHLGLVRPVTSGLASRGRGRPTRCTGRHDPAHARADGGCRGARVRRRWDHGCPASRAQGRPPQLTPPHQEVRTTLIDEGPGTAGCSRAYWHSPVIPSWLDDRFGVFSHRCSLAQELNPWSGRGQQATGVSAPLDEDTWHVRRTTTWPEMRHLANVPTAPRRFGDAASCPQGWTLISTGACGAASTLPSRPQARLQTRPSSG